MANNHTAGAAARTFAPSELCQRMLAKTSKGTCGPCILYLEDGTIFYGRACGASWGLVEGSEPLNVTITCPAGSAIETWAAANGISTKTLE